MYLSLDREVHDQRTRFSEFLNASSVSSLRVRYARCDASSEVGIVLSKGVWWMPRLKKAMKDVVWRRYASGRCPATFDPEISEWGNPIK